MQALTQAQLMSVWDAGREAHPIDRAVRVLGCAGLEPAHAADLPVGQRDRALFDLRLLTFGPRVDAVLDCPGCGTTLQFDFDLPALYLPIGTAGGTASEGPWSAVFRSPSSRDIAAVAAVPSQDVEAALIDRCVEFRLDGQPTDQPIPETFRQRVAREMVASDPQAHIDLAFECDECSCHWETSFDIIRFLWAEIEHAARGLLREVDALAREYGWTEPEILAIPSERRAFYLGLRSE